MKKSAYMLVCLVLLLSCGQGNKGGKGSGEADDSAALALPFPTVKVPSLYNDFEGRRKYVLAHYWDDFFALEGITSEDRVLGVRTEAVEQALANYLGLLNTIPMGEAQSHVSDLFRRIEKKQECDTSRRHYLKFTEIVSRYLYDPNSPLRNEDLYLPFVKGMAESPCTSPELRQAYEYEAKMCSINQYGQKVPEVRYRTLDGRKESLYGIKADYVVLFFSNPGCTACKEIMDQLRSLPYIDEYIVKRKVAVLNIYIDEEVNEWRKYAPIYPLNWHNGYDYTFSIRNNEDFHVRAIPSLYLLDKEKRVVMKDAPTERVIAFLDKI